jgi:hypothetical protein
MFRTAQAMLKEQEGIHFHGRILTFSAIARLP